MKSWNLEIFPEILKSLLKSWNLSRNPKISKSHTEFFQWSTPHYMYRVSVTKNVRIWNASFREFIYNEGGVSTDKGSHKKLLANGHQVASWYSVAYRTWCVSFSSWSTVWLVYHFWNLPWRKSLAGLFTLKSSGCSHSLLAHKHAQCCSLPAFGALLQGTDPWIHRI